MQEEVIEFIQAENTEELADVLEVIEAIFDFKKINKAELETVKKKKTEDRGVFKKKIILEESS